MSEKATINSIAVRAGVSRGTVDRVLNQRPHVRQDVRSRVIKAMREMNYVPPTEEQARALGLILPAQEHCRLGILITSEQGHFRTEIMRGLKAAQEYLRLYSVEVLVEECVTDMPEETVERISTLLDQQVSGLAVCAKEHPMIVEKINDMYEQGIPVVVYNSDISNCKRLCYIGQDSLQVGRVAGELMCKYLKPGDHLLVGIGNPNFSAHQARADGFCKRLYEHGFGKDTLQIIETYNNYDLTYERVRASLRGDPSICGIYMANHSISGCAEAVREVGLRGKVHIICHDLNESAKRLLQRGEIDFVIAQNIQQQSYRALIVLYEYIQEHKLPKDGPPSIDIICSENIAGHV